MGADDWGCEGCNLTDYYQDLAWAEERAAAEKAAAEKAAAEKAAPRDLAGASQRQFRMEVAE